MNSIKDFFIIKNPNEQIIITRQKYDNLTTTIGIIFTLIFLLFLLIYNLYRIGGLV